MAELPKYFYFRVYGGVDKVEIRDKSDADVVEVVRCRDCVDCIDGFVCKNGQFRGRTFPNNFCSDGERRAYNGN